MPVATIKISPVNIEARKGLGLRAGDTVRVVQKVVDKGAGKDGKDKTRLQAFEGLILSVKHGTEAGGTFTVRRVVDSVGVERIFPLYSPLIESIEITRRARVRRAKLYHIREKAAKEIRKQMKTELRLELKKVSESDAPAVVASAPEVTEKETTAVKE